MKKLRTVALFLIFVIFLSGCEFLEGLKCEHELKTTTVDATCDEDGYEIITCSKCDYKVKSDTKAKLGHDYGEWQFIKEASEVSDGLKKRVCKRCLQEEQQYIPSPSLYVDLTYVKEPFNQETVYKVKSFDELFVKFQTAVISRASTLKCEHEFALEDSNFLKNLVSKCDATFPFVVEASLKDSYLVVEFNYDKEPSEKFTTMHYTQCDSLNYSKPTSTRPANFEDFKIEDSLYSFSVQTTDQLFYVLERGVKPVCKEGSTAERAYKELKAILIDIVDDSMTDYQKVMAIYEYLIMNVTYDNELYGKIGSSGFVFSNYNSFYLEGVLFDKLAVCEGISKAFASLCNIEGIPSVMVTGYSPENPNGVGHAWNKVYLGGKWYVIDTTSGDVHVGDKEVLSYNYCLIDENKYSDKYIGENFTNIKCENTINVYETMSFNYRNEKHDFVIKNQEEMDVLIAYIESVNKDIFSVEFMLDFACGSSALDEVQNAYRNNGLASKINQIKYNQDGDLFVIYKLS